MINDIQIIFSFNQNILESQVDLIPEKNQYLRILFLKKWLGDRKIYIRILPLYKKRIVQNV